MADVFSTVLTDDFSNGYLTSNWGQPFDGGMYWNNVWSWSGEDVNVRDGEMQVTMTEHADGSWTAGGFNSFKAGNTITYGTIDFDARVEEAQGTMAAILTWPESDNWPRDGEIDILETPFQTSMHSSHYEDAGWSGGHAWDSQFSDTDPSQWNHYTLTWMPDEMTVSMNGEVVATWTDPAMIPDVPHGFGAMGFVGGPADTWMGGGTDGSTPSVVTAHIDNVVMKQWMGDDGSTGPAPVPVPEPSVPSTPAPAPAVTDVNLLLRGQSNAELFAQSGVWDLESKLEAQFGGAVDIHVITETHSGTAFLDWDTDGQQASLIRNLEGQSADIRDNPTVTVWMHNEYEQNGNGTEAQWLGEVKADAELVRDALGQNASTTPYVFTPVPYNYGQNWTWESGMKVLDADPAFNASMSNAFDGAIMDGDGYAHSSHMGGSDQGLVAAGLAEDVGAVIRDLIGGSAGPAPVPTTPAPTTPTPPPATSGVIDWAATSAAVTAHYEATGQWGNLDDFYVYVGAPAPTQPAQPPVVTPPVVTPPVVVPAVQEAGTGPDALVLHVSEQAWAGDAKFTVTVDGKQVGGEFVATAAHGEGSNAVTLHGDWGAGDHAVEVHFVNDGFDPNITDWSQPQANDRNLHIDSATYNGAAVSGAAADLLNDWSPASFSFTDAGAPPVVVTPAEPPVVTPPVVVPPVVTPPVVTPPVVTPPAEERALIEGGFGKDTLKVDHISHADIDAGAGKDRIILGSDHDDLHLIFDAGEVQGDRVTGFKAGDLIEFHGFGVGSVDALGDGAFKVTGEDGHSERFHVDGFATLGTSDFVFA